MCQQAFHQHTCSHISPQPLISCLHPWVPYHTITRPTLLIATLCPSCHIHAPSIGFVGAPPPYSPFGPQFSPPFSHPRPTYPYFRHRLADAPRGFPQYGTPFPPRLRMFLPPLFPGHIYAPVPSVAGLTPAALGIPGVRYEWLNGVLTPITDGGVGNSDGDREPSHGAQDTVGGNSISSFGSSPTGTSDRSGSGGTSTNSEDPTNLMRDLSVEAEPKETSSQDADNQLAGAIVTNQDENGNSNSNDNRDGTLSPTTQPPLPAPTSANKDTNNTTFSLNPTSISTSTSLLDTNENGNSTLVISPSSNRDHATPRTSTPSPPLVLANSRPGAPFIFSSAPAMISGANNEGEDGTRGEDDRLTRLEAPRREVRFASVETEEDSS